MRTILIGGFEETYAEKRHPQDTRVDWQVKSYALLQLVSLCTHTEEGIDSPAKVGGTRNEKKKRAVALDWETFISMGKLGLSEYQNFIKTKRLEELEEWNSCGRNLSVAVAYEWIEDIVDAAYGCGMETLCIVGRGQVFEDVLSLEKADEIMIFTPESFTSEERRVASNDLHAKAAVATKGVPPLKHWLTYGLFQMGRAGGHLYCYAPDS